MEHGFAQSRRFFSTVPRGGEAPDAMPQRSEELVRHGGDMRKVEVEDCCDGSRGWVVEEVVECFNWRVSSHSLGGLLG